MSLRIGIDVGGTHTDAVIIDEENHLIHAVKTETTRDVTTGIKNALINVLDESNINTNDVKAVMFGTTHCTNAIVERRELAKTGLIRVGRPGAEAIDPLVEWPNELKQAIGDVKYLVHGGHEYTGEEIVPFNEDEVREVAKTLKDQRLESIAICSIFSMVNADHEERTAEIVREVMGQEIPITLSHEVGSVGLLERENSAVLNAALVKVAWKAIEAFQKAMKDAGIKEASMFLTQNDGTLMSSDYARRYPILTVASGPTNSIRGAAFLTGLKDGIIVDIGGTTTLVGVLVKGFPRESSIAVEIGGVRTNFRMPDLIATGCGGGTLVRERDGEIVIGPDSVGYELVKKGLAWGGDTITTTDVALASGHAVIDDPRVDTNLLKHLNRNFLEKAMRKIIEALEESIDKIKTDPSPMPVVLVGGGGLLIPSQEYNKIKGVEEIIRPSSYQFANALGAAIAQVSGQIDKIYSFETTSREDVLEEAKRAAVERAINAGAIQETVQVVEIEETALPYLPGNAVRIRVKAVGDLHL
jgi:N-methylhydantoinase A/oxoprolinase/acetone carboxylase beta subunit